MSKAITSIIASKKIASGNPSNNTSGSAMNAPGNNQLMQLQQGQTRLSFDQLRNIHSELRKTTENVEKTMPKKDKEFWMNRGMDIMNKKISNSESGIKEKVNKDSGDIKMLSSAYKILGYGLNFNDPDRALSQIARGELSNAMEAVKLSGGNDADAKEFMERLVIFNQQNRNSEMSPSQKEKAFWNMTSVNAKSEFLKNYATENKTYGVTGLDINMPADIGVTALQIFEGKDWDKPPTMVGHYKDIFKNANDVKLYWSSLGALSDEQRSQLASSGGDGVIKKVNEAVNNAESGTTNSNQGTSDGKATETMMKAVLANKVQK